MTKRMLIDATHVEETRVAICDGNRLVEYDYESKNRKPLKGSIFLAKVTRVEPSLQAAFVNFGGNRHGFLPFSEIHPDYFRIPIEDREALMAEQEAFLKAHDEQEQREEELAEQSGGAEGSSESPDDENFEAGEGDLPAVEEVGGMVPSVSEDDDEGGQPSGSDSRSEDQVSGLYDDDDGYAADAAGEPIAQEHDDGQRGNEPVSDEDGPSEAGADAQQEPRHGDSQGEGRNRGRGRSRRFRGGRGRKRSAYRNPNVEVVGGEDADEGGHSGAGFRFNLRRKYKIQEVIKRGQIMLVQVSKEERGNKGAAVTTYLSLAGRYCVLMPNSPRGGGVSRKIANHNDRSRMREIMKDLEVPMGMSVILRTAGVSRTKVEIKRDLDYLLRLWDTIRDLTLQSTAPALVYEEADLIKRSIRDLYDRDIEEIHVAGADGFKNARDFMKMLVPSHVKKVLPYEEEHLPLFTRYQVESQISEIGQNQVRLRSGGYLVINPTEALVSIDVNSGKATKERHIEETALNTNLEAADEIARQLKLRDLGGLVVIDFIDMEDRRNNARVERRVRDALSKDRARVQVGRISSFGLMELSRQRLNPSLTEAQYETCHNCKGSGLVRTEDAMSIVVLRAIEEEGIRGRAAQLVVNITSRVALYILNYKRANLADIEKRYSLQVLIRVDDEIGASEHRIEVSRPSDKAAAERDVGKPPAREAPKPAAWQGDSTPDSDSDESYEDEEADDPVGNQRVSEDDSDEGTGNRRDEHRGGGGGGPREGGRRRGRRGGRGRRDKNREGRGEFREGGAREPRPGRDESSPKEHRVRDNNSSEPVAVSEFRTSEPAATFEPSPPQRDVVVEARPERKERIPSSSATYEVVSEAPKSKKKGWWNKLIE